MKVPFVDLQYMHKEIKNEMMTAMERVYDENSFIGGRYCTEFENHFAEYCVPTRQITPDWVQKPTLELQDTTT